jgi:hypothetical protein
MIKNAGDVVGLFSVKVGRTNGGPEANSTKKRNQQDMSLVWE